MIEDIRGHSHIISYRFGGGGLRQSRAQKGRRMGVWPIMSYGNDAWGQKDLNIIAMFKAKERQKETKIRQDIHLFQSLIENLINQDWFTQTIYHYLYPFARTSGNYLLINKIRYSLVSPGLRPQKKGLMQNAQNLNKLRFQIIYFVCNDNVLSK